ncbi:MAG: transcription initiation factor IIB [Candidatus Lokiarchaeota archaeon]
MGGEIISLKTSVDEVFEWGGLVLSERNVDFVHSGKRAYTKEEKERRERTGSPISRLTPNLSLTTVINRKNIQNPDLKRAAKWNTRMEWHQRNLLIATTELKRIATNLNIPDHVKSEALSYYKKAFKKKLLRGRSINSMVVAALYYAIRKKRIPRTFQEILDDTSETPRDVRRAYRALVRELNLKVPTTQPSSLVPRFTNELGLNSEIEKLTAKIVKTYRKNIPTSGKDPKGIVAGAFYLASKIKKLGLTQRDIANTVGVTEVTLRSRYQELKDKLKVEV